METKLPIHNPGPNTMYVGLHAIPAGETKVFDLHELPPEYHPKQEAATDAANAPVDDLAELLKQPEGSLLAAIPTLSDEHLERLGDLEQTSAMPRQAILAAIAEELLNRASSTVDPEVQAMLDKPEAELLAALQDFPSEKLEALYKAEQAKDDEARSAVLECLLAEAARRSVGAFLLQPEAEILAVLPSLSVDRLQVLLEAEQASAERAPRPALIDAIVAEQAKRAGASQDDVVAELSKRNVTDIKEAVSTLADADLVRLGDLELANPTPRKTVMDAIAAEQEKRKG